MQSLPIYFPIRIEIKPENRCPYLRQNFHPLHGFTLLILALEHITPLLRLRSLDIGKHSRSPSAIRYEIHEKRGLTIPWFF